MGSLFIGILLAASPAFAAETAVFLDIGVGARGLGMGGAYTALADDANAIYWNPAGLAHLDKREVTASDAELGLGARLGFAGYAHPTSRGTLAAAVTYLSQSALDGRDAFGRPTGSFSASDAAVTGAYGFKTDFVDLGVGVKYLRSHIGSLEAQGAAMDFGARRVLGGAGPGHLVLGATLRNVGSELKYDIQRNDLPLRLAGGAAYALPRGRTLALEIQNGPRGTGTDVGFGGEIRALESVFLRLGYSTKNVAVGGAGFDAARGLTAGLGLVKRGCRFDYSAQAAGELANTHRFTLSKRF